MSLFRARWPVALAVLAAAGCSSENAGAPSCESGTVGACRSGDGTPGLRSCGAGGTWQACRSDDLVVEPAALDFGLAAPGVAVERTVSVGYRGEGSIPIRSAALVGSAHFRLAAAPDRIPGGGAALFVIAFTPPSDRLRAVGRLRIELDAGDGTLLEVPLSGGNWIGCDVDAVDFGEVEPGTLWGRDFECTNGSDAVLAVTAEVVGGDGAFEVVAPRPGATVAAGAKFWVTVRHRAARTGARAATLAIRAADRPWSLELPLRALDVFRTCSLEVTLPSLRLLPGGTDRGSLRLGPLLAHGCGVRAIRVDPSCDPAFVLEDWPASLDVLSDVHLPVRVHADREGTFLCPLVLEVADEEEPERPLVLEARAGWAACVDFASSADVSARAASCPNVGFLRPANRCEDRISVASIELEGTPSFSLVNVPALPTIVLPNASWDLAYAFRPLVVGTERAAVILRGPGGESVSIPITGHALERQPYVDRWETGPAPGLDVLVVIDNGVGMAAEQDRVLAALGPLPDLLRGRADYRLAVTTASLAPSPACGGPAGGGERGRLVPIDGARPRVVTPDTPDARAVWEANLRVGACHDGPNEALAAARLALTPPLVDQADDTSSEEPGDGNAGFYRPDADTYLAVVLVSDREDVSPGSDVFYFNSLWALKPGRTASWKESVSAISGDSGVGCSGTDGEAATPGDRWAAFSSRWEFHAFSSICSVEAPLELPNPLAPQRCFPFSAGPADFDGDGALTDTAGELAVRVNGVPVPSFDDAGPVWEAEALGWLCFAEGRAPGWNSTVEAEYAYCDPR